MRMVVPGLYGYVSATKWVVELEVTRFAGRPRLLDRPRLGRARPDQDRVAHRRARERDGDGTCVVAGVAWHQHTGISKVEVQVDDGAVGRGRAGRRDLDRHLGAVALPRGRAAGDHTLRGAGDRCRRRDADARMSRTCCPTARPATTRSSVSL